MDTYKELLIKRKKSLIGTIVKIVLIIIAVAFVLYPSIFGIIIAAVLVGLAYFVNLNSDIEYEYLYLDKELSVDKIMAKSRRKKVATYDLEKVEIIASEGSHQLDSYNARSNSYKTVNFTSNGGENGYDTYVIYYEGKEKVFIEAPVEFMRAIYNNAPRKVFL